MVWSLNKVVSSMILVGILMFHPSLESESEFRPSKLPITTYSHKKWNLYANRGQRSPGSKEKYRKEFEIWSKLGGGTCGIPDENPCEIHYLIRLGADKLSIHIENSTLDLDNNEDYKMRIIGESLDNLYNYIREIMEEEVSTLKDIFSTLKNNPVGSDTEFSSSPNEGLSILSNNITNIIISAIEKEDFPGKNRGYKIEVCKAFLTKYKDTNLYFDSRYGRYFISTAMHVALLKLYEWHNHDKMDKEFDDENVKD